MAEYLDVAQPIIEIDSLTKEFKATAYFEDYLYRIIQGLGGEGAPSTGDSISTTVSADKIPYLFGLVYTLGKKVSQLEAGASNSVMAAAIKLLESRTANFITTVKTQDSTAKNKDFFEARNSITVKLPANARRSDEVIVANGDGSKITIDGNGNNIKYTTTDTSVIMRSQGTSLHFHFFIDNVSGDSYWRVV